MDDCSIRRGVADALSRPHHLAWFRAATGFNVDDGQRAADVFFENADNFDSSPFRFFDPQWFRSRYRVDGPNAFLSYLRNSRQRLAVPSPLFAPRWYTRRYRLSPAIHPLLDYLRRDDRNDPHPLVDLAYLRSQGPGLEGGVSEGRSGDETAWQEDQAVFGYLTDASQFRLKPHPLFDSGWYLDNNPDVAAAGMNPLEHYLQFGHLEGRNPNRIFNVRWYRKQHLKRRNDLGKEPLTNYAVSGCFNGKEPAPGLWTLSKSSIRFTQHGPAPVLDCLQNGRSLYANLLHCPEIPVEAFREHMLRIQDCNPAMPEHIVFLSKQRVALMYTAKSASAKLVYWWLDQAGLLDFALKFTSWSHSFEEIYRSSRAYLNDALIFDPDRYHIYKFVRSPFLRAVSGFTQLLTYPDAFGLTAYDRPLSFLDFLDRVQSSHYFNNDFHFRLQQTPNEASGLLRPSILKIEEGLDSHLRNIELGHGLKKANYSARPEIRKTLLDHTRQNRREMFVGPDVPIPFYKVPDGRSLLTSKAIERIYEIYRVDFEAYGYAKQLN